MHIAAIGDDNLHEMSNLIFWKIYIKKKKKKKMSSEKFTQIAKR